METSRAILLGSLLISASLIGDLAYRVYSDREMSATHERELSRMRADAVQSYRTREALRAWSAAVYGLHGRFDKFIESRIDRHLLPIRNLGVRPFSYNDVIWNDDKHVSVTGVLVLYDSMKSACCFAWTTNVDLADSGHWFARESYHFTDADMSFDTMRKSGYYPIRGAGVGYPYGDETGGRDIQ